MSRAEMEAAPVADLITRLSFYNEAREQEERMAWERTRLQTLRIVALFAKRGSLDPKRFWPLPWDNEGQEDPPQLTQEEKDESLRRLLAKDREIHGN